MNYRNTQKGSRQQGFFTVGAGLVLLAIYGAIGTGVLVAHNPSPTDGQQRASNPPPQLSTVDDY